MVKNELAQQKDHHVGLLMTTNHFSATENCFSQENIGNSPFCTTYGSWDCVNHWWQATTDLTECYTVTMGMPTAMCVYKKMWMMC